MSYVAQKKNRIIRIPEEKAEEYAKMGYEITNEDGEVACKTCDSHEEKDQSDNKLQGDHGLYKLRSLLCER